MPYRGERDAWGTWHKDPSEGPAHLLIPGGRPFGAHAWSSFMSGFGNRRVAWGQRWDLSGF